MAEYFYCADTVQGVGNALEWANSQGLPVHVLGAGSNVILGERIRGLVLQALVPGIELLEERGDEVFLRVAAGENWHKLVEYSVGHGYFGLENLALIPGLAGAAPMQNIGAYGVELKDVFYSLEAMDRKDASLRTFSLAQCGFAYRDSVFKNALLDRYIILSLVLRLSKTPRVNLSYPELSQMIEKRQVSITPQNIMETIVNIRRAKLPDPASIPNAGSFFKNPVVSREAFNRLKEKYADIPGYSLDDGQKKLPAAWLIDSLGLKDYNQQGVCLHPKQALVITNRKQAIRREVLDFAENIRVAVEAEYGLWLEIEPRCLG